MDKRTIIAELIDVANILDENNMTNEADILTKVASDLLGDHAFDVGIPQDDDEILPFNPDGDMDEGYNEAADLAKKLQGPPTVSDLLADNYGGSDSDEDFDAWLNKIIK